MALFDGEASAYDTWFSVKLGKYADEIETKLLFDLLQPQSGMKILDVGCGTGNISIKLARMGCKVTGIDVSAKMLEMAKTKTALESLDIEYFMQDIYETDYQNDFDAICSNTAFEFLPDKEKAIEKMLQAVKQGGKIVIGTINKNSDWYDYYAEEIKKENSFFSIFKYAHFISDDEIVNLSKKHFVKLEKGLFLPPTTEENAIIAENDIMQYEKGTRGGFLCSLWIK
jgi:ubiquinone biosynthesis O-methyltransferase